MITITTDAASQIRYAAEQSGTQGMALRIAARRCADGSIDYGMGFDEVREQDVELSSEGIALLIGEASRDLLVGTVLDFVEFEPGDFRFIFIPADEAALAEAPSCGSGGCSKCGGAG